MNPLEILTFTGVDRRTDLTELADIAGQYPKVEFGVLVGTHTDMEDRGIFPSLSIVSRFRKAAEGTFRTALHLCGQHSRAIMGTDASSDSLTMHSAAVCPPTGSLDSLCDGFGRVQVNLHGDHWDPRHIAVNAVRIKAFADRITEGSVETVILQHRGVWADVPVRHRAIEYLYDTSEGRGRDSISQWPAPDGKLGKDVRLGFAGGLGAHNMAQAMAFARKHAGTRLWMDMEGRVRTDGWFDLAKVREVCAIAFGGR